MSMHFKTEYCLRSVSRGDDILLHVVGQAFVIFERKDVAKMVIERLDEGCLLLPNGR